MRLREDSITSGRTHSFFEFLPVPSFKSSRLLGSASQMRMSYSNGSAFNFESIACSISSSDIKLRIGTPP